MSLDKLKNEIINNKKFKIKNKMSYGYTLESHEISNTILEMIKNIYNFNSVTLYDLDFKLSVYDEKMQNNRTETNNTKGRDFKLYLLYIDGLGRLFFRGDLR